MTRQPPQPPPSRRPERGVREQAQPGERQPGKPRPEEPRPEEPQPGERYGPVVIARHVKDDGRALLLYTGRAHERP